MEKNHKFNLLYLTPSTVPMFFLGYLNKSVALMIVGFLLLAFYIIVGCMQLLKRKKGIE
ncbi:hypothetical protein ACFSO7_15050 [Bacillus sp. CGMCC 1.16607]|uniref:hypothetical protein n=1 Tax=Bacillus sp. CGMCC 1.16607 TaxID=3351842 RepID=UPI003642E4BA